MSFGRVSLYTAVCSSPACLFGAGQRQAGPLRSVESTNTPCPQWFRNLTVHWGTSRRHPRMVPRLLRRVHPLATTRWWNLWRLSADGMKSAVDVHQRSRCRVGLGRNDLPDQHHVIASLVSASRSTIKSCQCICDHQRTVRSARKATVAELVAEAIDEPPGRVLLVLRENTDREPFYPSEHGIRVSFACLTNQQQWRIERDRARGTASEPVRRAPLVLGRDDHHARRKSRHRQPEIVSGTLPLLGRRHADTS